jgi:hypothetical protein
MQLRCFETKLPNLEFKTQPKQLLGNFLIDIAIPGKLHLLEVLLGLIMNYAKIKNVKFNQIYKKTF